MGNKADSTLSLFFSSSDTTEIGLALQRPTGVGAPVPEPRLTSCCSRNQFPMAGISKLHPTPGRTCLGQQVGVFLGSYLEVAPWAIGRAL